jgi:sugar phosphate isomerase/epimerase
MDLDRRAFLGAALACRAAAGPARITLDRISLLTDEIARSPEDAIAFCKQYGVRWVELRAVPGGGGTYAQLDEPVLLETAKQLKQAGLRVSFLNTPMLKFTLPGTEPARRRNETPEQKQQREARERARFERRHEELAKALRAAEIFEVPLVRVFTFTRVAEPAEFLPTVAEILAPMAAEARGRGMKLLVENEGSCNVATSAELRRICELVTDAGLGINWDPVNALSFQEEVWPDGYKQLPLDRLGNVQMKARGLVVGPVMVPWKEIFDALARDGYPGKIGLETHIFDGTLIEKAHLCMREIQKLVSGS